MWLIALAILSVVIWAYLIFGHGRFWECTEALPEAGATRAPAHWPGVVAVIPARDEAEVIGAAIASHQKTAYEGPFAIVLVDDNSSDGTKDAARKASEVSGDNYLLDIAVAPEPEPGWTGKLWAMQTGLKRAALVAPTAQYVLFTDADIVHDPDVLPRLVGLAEAKDKTLVSLMARLDDRGFWAGLLIPAFVFFFQMLYPFPRVNSWSSRTAAAAGGCMLVRRADLEAEGGLAAIHGKLIDDCALARLIKGDPPRRDIWLGVTTGVHSLRDNSKLGALWTMITRSAYTQLNYSPLLLLATLVGLAVTFMVPPLLFVTWPLHQTYVAGWLGGIASVAMAVAYSPTLRLYVRPSWQAVGLPFAALLYAAMTADSARRHWLGKGGLWKGRTYDPAAGQA